MRKQIDAYAQPLMCTGWQTRAPDLGHSRLYYYSIREIRARLGAAVVFAEGREFSLSMLGRFGLQNVLEAFLELNWASGPSGRLFV